MNNFRKINKQEYEELFRQTLFKTFFHEVEFHEFLEKEFKWLEFEYYIYNQELLFPVAKIGKKMISLPFCEYGGPLPLKKNINLEYFEKDVLTEFGENTRGEFDSLKVKFHPQILRTSNLELRTSNLSTHWIENLKTTSEQELWDSLRKTLRHEIKKAQDHGIEVRRCDNLKELKRFYNLYVANLRRKKTIPYPWKILHFLYQNPSSELLLAFYGDKIIAGDMFLNYSGFVHYFLSASDYKYRNFSAAHLILWEKIKGLINKDVIFDLGATPKNSSLNIFKAGWGGKEYPILQIGIKRNAENLRSSKLRSIWGLLPNWLIKILASKLIKFRL